MKRTAIMIGCALICFGATNCRAQDFLVKNPGITGIAVAPVASSQCLPVRISFTLANTTDVMIYSQRPYSGDGYNLYQSFQGSGMEVLPDRYTVGVSLNDGQDGYPYRWGFRGALPPGRTTTITGYLTLVELGTYQLTGMLFKGGSPADMRVVKIGKVTIDVCEQVQYPEQPTPAEPIYPVINGQPMYPPMSPYMVNGYMYVPARQYFNNIGADIISNGYSVVVTRPGMEFVMYPGRRYAMMNGIRVIMPMSPYTFDGVTYVAPRFMGPLFGGSVYWNSYTRQLFLGYGGWGW